MVTIFLSFHLMLVIYNTLIIVCFKAPPSSGVFCLWI